jgi:thioredoxin reductase (NADPH)
MSQPEVQPEVDATEGLDTLVIEGQAPGGQAGTSSKIENDLGFPTGSGQALAGRAQVQAQRFGARLAISQVHMLVRGKGLAASMSDYLVQRIAASPRITLHTETEITALEGDTMLRSAAWTNGATGVSETRAVRNVFAMLGAAPNTEWLDGCLALDAQGFVVAGADAGAAAASSYAASRAGVFAVGDVRAGSTERVASGAGEGSVVVAAIHRVLEAMRA